MNGDDNLNFWMEKKRIWLYIEQEWLNLSLIHTHTQAVLRMVVLNKSD